MVRQIFNINNEDTAGSSHQVSASQIDDCLPSTSQAVQESPEVDQVKNTDFGGATEEEVDDPCELDSEYLPNSDIDMFDEEEMHEKLVERKKRKYSSENETNHDVVDLSVLELKWVQQVLRPTGHGRITFSEDEKKKIFVSFFKDLSNDKIPSRSKITESLKSDYNLFDIVENHPRIKFEEKILGCLRNLLNRKSKIDMD